MSRSGTAKGPIKSYGLAALVAACSLSVAACSSSSKAASPPTTSASSSSSGGASPSTAAPATGSPITIFLETSINSQVASVPEEKASLLAGVANINANGGIGGHPLKPVVCDDEENPSLSIACARQAQSVGAVACVGCAITFDPTALAYVQERIPIIGFGATTTETTSSYSFPMDRPGFSESVATLLHLGITKYDLATCDLAVCATQGPPAKSILQYVGLPASNMKLITIPLTATNYAPYVAKVLSDNPPGFFCSDTTAVCLAMFKGLRAGGYKGPVAVSTTGLQAKDVASVGPGVTGFYVSQPGISPFNTSVPAVQEYRAEMAKTEPTAPVDGYGLQTYQGLQLFAAVAKSITGEINAASVEQALTNVTTLNLPILGGPYKVKDYVNPIPSQTLFNRAFNNNEAVDEVENGTLVPVVKSANIFTR